MGRRLVGPWPGYWAFPGGGVEDHETHLEAGIRELYEETLISVPVTTPLLKTLVLVEFGERKYLIENYVIEVAECLAGTTTSELEPRWVTIEQTAELSPIANGTQTVLDRVGPLFGQGP